MRIWISTSVWISCRYGKDEYTIINEMSKNTGYDGFENVLQAIDKARVRLDANVNFELAMELMLLAMKEN